MCSVVVDVLTYVYLFTLYRLPLPLVVVMYIYESLPGYVPQVIQSSLPAVPARTRPGNACARTLQKINNILLIGYRESGLVKN